MPKFDLYQSVTDRIIAAIEAGTPPWRCPWTGTGGGARFPLRSTGERYRGINVLLLWLTAMEKDYALAHWFTFRQASALGARVRKGERSCMVIYYNVHERETEAGETKRLPFARSYNVFNADQIDGLPEDYIRAPDPARDLGTQSDPVLDAFFAATGARIETSARPRAFYRLDDDVIHMPPVATFHSTAGYFGTLAHESLHWTGHKSRLDRFPAFIDKRGRAREELVAEIGAAMTCARLGCDAEIPQSAAYVESWLEVLEDKRAIFAAATAAQAGADHLFKAAAAGGWTGAAQESAAAA